MAVSHKDEDGITRWALILAFIVAGFFLVITRDTARLRLATPNTVDNVNSPALAVISKPIRSLESLIFGFQDRTRAFEENKALRAELQDLREAQARMDVMAMKIARYEQILAVNAKTDIPLKKIGARAVSESNGPFVRSLLINAGQVQGVKTGNPVMSVDGLIGHVISAGRTSSRVLMLGDLNSRISVMAKGHESRAILAGDNSAQPKLSFVSEGEPWAEGDVVITSGDDGMLPRGLFIGEVVQSEAGTLRVRLGASKTALDWVWVSPYTPFVMTEPDPSFDQVTEGTDAEPSEDVPG